MPKLIHIPQGTAGILVEGQSNPEISGLYTHGFSTCNVIAFINKGRIGLLHFDWYTDESAINDLLAKMGDKPKIIVIYRDTGLMLKERITSHLKNYKSQVNLETKVIQNNLDGVCLYVTSSAENNLDSQIKILPLHGKNVGVISTDDLPNASLERHPREREFAAVRKMEQLIGVKARHAVKQPNGKYKISPEIVNKGRCVNHLIFDGQYWLSMDAESVIDESHVMTKEEMDYVRKNNNCYLTLSGALGGIAQGNGGFHEQDLKESALSIGFWTEDYLRKEQSLDEEHLLRRNLQDTLTEKRKDARIEGELKFIAEFQELLKRNAAPNNLQKCIESLRSYIKGENFAYFMCDEFNTLHGHYLERKIYIDHQLALSRKIKASNQAYEKGLTAIRETKYSEGIELFKECLKLSHETLYKGDMRFCEIHYRCAICNYKAGNFDIALQEIVLCDNLMSDTASKLFKKQIRQFKEEITDAYKTQSIPAPIHTTSDEDKMTSTKTMLKQ